MRVEYWICDYCNKEIERDEIKKFNTPEMGYPYIPKGGGGKHFHLACLVKEYSKKGYTRDEIDELIEDAERRHQQKIDKQLGTGKKLNKDDLEAKKSTKEDREILINYFYDYYGIKVISKELSRLIDCLNAGKPFSNIKDIQISYSQLKDMLEYYRKELDSSYVNKTKKDGFVNPLLRIFRDIIIVINNLQNYMDRKQVRYNAVNNNKVDGGETLEDLSPYIVYRNPRDNDEDFAKAKEIKDFINEMMKEAEEEEEKNKEGK